MGSWKEILRRASGFQEQVVAACVVNQADLNGTESGARSSGPARPGPGVGESGGSVAPTRPSLQRVGLGWKTGRAQSGNSDSTGCVARGPGKRHLCKTKRGLLRAAGGDNGPGRSTWPRAWAERGPRPTCLGQGLVW